MTRLPAIRHRPHPFRFRRMVSGHLLDAHVAMIFPALFFLVITGAVFAGAAPPFVPALYLGASAFTFAIYARDKSAARGNRRRISERTLHLCSLACGWPGALLAQRTLRHKTVKQTFQRAFRATAALNCGVLFLCLFPDLPMRILSLFRS